MSCHRHTQPEMSTLVKPQNILDSGSFIRGQQLMDGCHNSQDKLLTFQIAKFYCPDLNVAELAQAVICISLFVIDDTQNVP